MATFGYEMRLAEGGRVLAKGHTKHVFIGRDFRRVQLPEKYHAMFGLSETRVEQ